MFWVQSYGNKQVRNGYRLFYAEKESDIEKLPTEKRAGTQGGSPADERCSIGSECFCVGNGMIYVLTTDGWKGTALGAGNMQQGNGGTQPFGYTMVQGKL